MAIQWRGFNTYLGLAVAGALLFGCQTAEEKRQKKEAVLRVHIESSSPQSKEAPVYRERPITMRIHPSPICTEQQVKEAGVVDAVGGFALRLQFDRQGSHLLEQYTAGNRGKHLVIFGSFPNRTNLDLYVDRWLAAPKITQRIADGTLIFTPDASRDEAEQIAQGLNNVARKLKTGKEP